MVTSEGLVTVEELYLRATPNTVLGRSGPVSAGPMLLPRPDAPIVKILTREGYQHKVTPDHKVWVVDRGWTEAQHLQKGDRLEIQQMEGLWGREVPPGRSVPLRPDRRRRHLRAEREDAAGAYRSLGE